MCRLQGFVVGRGVELGSAVVVRIVELGIVLGCDSFSLGLGIFLKSVLEQGLDLGRKASHASESDLCCRSRTL